MGWAAYGDSYCDDSSGSAVAAGIVVVVAAEAVVAVAAVAAGHRDAGIGSSTVLPSDSMLGRQVSIQQRWAKSGSPMFAAVDSSEHR